MGRVLLLGIIVIVVVSFVPVQATQPSAFADPAFEAFYDRSGPTGQTLVWGNGPLISMVEPYSGAPGNRRLVQYFDRGRMELSASTQVADIGDPEMDVTQGLLVREMATGNVQVGHDAFVQGDPASVAILGSASAPAGSTALTYADFAEVARARAGDRTETANAVIDAWIAPGGQLSHTTPPIEVRASRYVDATGHNIPDVFVEWFERSPFGELSQQDALGYPITEPFWVHSGKGASGISLIQLYERRVVVYTPDLPEGERFSLSNTGRHYYRWRYGNDPTGAVTSQRTERSVLPAARNDAGLTLPQGFQASVVRRDLSDLFGIAVAPNGHLVLGHSSGSVTVLDPANPDAYRGVPAIDHLANPVALAMTGTDIYVVDDAGLHRYQDIDVDGVIDVMTDIDAPGFARETVSLAPGPDGTLYYSGQPVAVDGSTTATTLAGTSRSLLLIAPGEDAARPVTMEIETGGPLMVDTDGVIWVVDSTGMLTQVIPGVRSGVTFDTGQYGDGRSSGIRSLLLYRADGGNGDAYSDMIAIATSDDGRRGRIVRLHPPRPVDGQSDASPTAVQSGAVIDFITGFDRPTVMTSGFDGSLYVYDAARGDLYWIRPL